MRKIFMPIFIILVSSAGISSAGTYNLEKIVVTPSRIPQHDGKPLRSMTLIDDYMRELSPYQSTADLIGNVGGIDVRRRGPEGVQADINIRGANFEQNSIMIDGVKVNDPQTGHFNMDIPLAGIDIDRIEILKGPASSVYGPNSFGGTINIITKRPEGNRVSVLSEGGSFDYFKSVISADSSFRNISNRFSIEDSRSSGYMNNTEFNNFTISDTASFDTAVGRYDFLFGYLKKDFGAASFYSNLFPNEEEHTDTRFFKISADIERGGLKMEPRLFLRRHRDKFILDTNRPGWQTSYHTTYTYGGEANFVIENDFSDIAYGYELSYDSINSTSLAKHSRTKDGIYAEISPHIIEKLYLNAGVRSDYFSDFGWQVSPSINARYDLGRGFGIRSSIGRAYRVPTFTDLYYRDSANIGNPSLRPESSWSYEAGLDHDIDFVTSSLTFFHRDTYDAIDWTRNSSRDPWRVSNTGTIDTNGLELSLILYPKKISAFQPFEKAFFNYTALDSYLKHSYLSKYALDYLKHHISAGAEYDIGGFKNSWVVNWKKRVGGDDSVIVDTKVVKEIICKGKLSVQLFLEITNVLSESYSEQSGVAMPGRSIRSGAKVEF